MRRWRGFDDGGRGFNVAETVLFPVHLAAVRSITTTTTRAYIENHGGQSSCHDSWTGTLSFSVSGSRGGAGFTLILALQGKVTGIIYAGLTVLMADGLCGRATGPPTPVPFVNPTHAAGSSHLRVLMHGGVDVCGGSNNSDVLTADTTFALAASGS